MNVKNRPVSVLTALALALALVGCGDDDDEPAGAVVTEPAGAAATEPAGAATSPPSDTTAAGRGDYAPATDTASAPASDAPAGGADIAISGFAFSDDITVPVGTTVVVRNEDDAGHTFTADDHSFDSGNIEAGGTFEFTFTEAGTFPFHCDIHPSMTGTVTVTG